jgi:hypothetical protein
MVGIRVCLIETRPASIRNVEMIWDAQGAASSPEAQDSGRIFPDRIRNAAEALSLPDLAPSPLPDNVAPPLDRSVN